MQSGRSSRTAEFMALFRALESTGPPGRRLFDDPFAATFVSAPLRRVVRWSAVPVLGTVLRQIIDHLWPGARSSGVARTRLIDDWIAASIANGSQQLVVLGAGFDSRAWRMPALVGVPIFEVDHPATMAEKRRGIAAATAESDVVSVALDFDRDRLPDALDAAGFDPSRHTTVVWEGVTNYLTEDAVRSVLAWAGSLAAGEKILLAVASAGEPWTFGWVPEALSRCLQAHGLRLEEDLGADDYRA